MDVQAGRWAVILAGGDGTRLRSLTTGRDGVAVPKQYCSFGGGPSLLRHAIFRASTTVPWNQIVVVVAAAHRRFFEPELRDIPPANILVQPENRGTAPGLLYPVLRHSRRDPDATILVLPADHHVADERTLAEALRRAVSAAHATPHRVVLLGVTPEELDPDFGWIVPEGRPGGVPAGEAETGRDVAAFVEKPDAASAARLLADGALVSTFILAGRVKAILRLDDRAQPALLLAFARSGDAADVAGLYASVPPCDLSREVLERTTWYLKVLRVPPCGWGDLGTPPRVARALGPVRITSAA